MPRKHGHRVKSHTHRPAQADGKGIGRRGEQVRVKSTETPNVPKCFIVRRGPRVSGAVLELSLNLRKLFSPNCAERLKERKSNKIKDYVAVSGLLGVSHLLLLSQHEARVNLSMAQLPKGPSLTFRVTSFTLMADILAVMPRGTSLRQYQYAPLVIMAGFSGFGLKGRSAVYKAECTPEDWESKLRAHTLARDLFKGLFPVINPREAKLRTHCNRVVQIHYCAESDIYELRHYAIDLRPSEVSESVSNLIREYVHATDSTRVESLMLLNPLRKAGEENDRKIPEDSSPTCLEPSGEGSFGEVKVKLTEIGPRISLQLVKGQAGVCDGKVLYHSYVKKTEEQMHTLDLKHGKHDSSDVGDDDDVDDAEDEEVGDMGDDNDDVQDVDESIEN